MSEETTIERVAKAIATANSDTTWTFIVLRACAALLAMREPTIAMLTEALRDLADWGCLLQDWQAMIDHVAKEVSE
jgi:hypothetical protein